jgi:hypothetical protein
VTGDTWLSRKKALDASGPISLCSGIREAKVRLLFAEVLAAFWASGFTLGATWESVSFDKLNAGIATFTNNRKSKTFLQSAIERLGKVM